MSILDDFREEYGFIPNWITRGFKTREEAIKAIIEHLKSDKSHFFSTGNNSFTLMNGNMEVLLDLKGKEKKKKDKEDVEEE